ncbi:hypothetical protein NADE_005949 [Nannochloris sp. 'desiccata']|nr:hypothetical protein NADE_005949 [Chlorella desiccata (nom. nud.)]
MHCGENRSFKATAPRATTAVVATPLFGRCRQCPCSTLSCGRPSQSSYPKLPSISSRDFQRSILRTVPHIPRAAKDDVAIAQPAAAAEPYITEEWPDFSKIKVDPYIEDTFFNRKEEYDMIMSHLDRKPTVPLLLLGPKNSGKSKLLETILEQESSRMLYLDLGMQDVSSPALMAKQLRNQARKLAAMLCMQFTNSIAAPAEDILTAFMADFFPEPTNLPAVINSYKVILDIMPPGQKKPIIVIDEANALTLWKKGFDENVRRDEVLGDLTSAEAFVYVCGGKVSNRKGAVEDWPGLMAQSEETRDLGMTPEEWKEVWSVCGGNMHLLRICVAYATQYKSWDEGVREILSGPQMAVTKALEYPELIDPPIGSAGPRIWEGKHYKAVLRLIAASPYHAVRRKEVHAALENVGILENVTAAQVLLSMVEFNVLSLRPYSKMAKDLPREAFFKDAWGIEEQDNVVTMPSPAHLAAVLILEIKFQKQDQAERNHAQAAKGKGQSDS